jgi:predicted Zn-dependent protease
MVGGNTGANLETFIGASYSRSAEAEADEDAIRMLRSAGISPSGAADFFARVAGDEERLGMLGQGLSYISTHPDPAARERRFRTAAAAQSYKPPLTPAEWQALRGICGGNAQMPRG